MRLILLIMWTAFQSFILRHNNDKTYIAPISILLFSSALKNKNISKKNYEDCIKYTKCMNLPKRVKTIMSTLKL